MDSLRVRYGTTLTERDKRGSGVGSSPTLFIPFEKTLLLYCLQVIVFLVGRFTTRNRFNDPIPLSRGRPPDLVSDKPP